MKNSRSKVLAGIRGIQNVRDIVQDEAARVRGGRKSLSFGISDAEVDEALEDLNSIEAELLEELGIYSVSSLGLLCP